MEVQQQAGKLLNHVAGYVGLRTIELGLRHGILAEIHNHPEGINVEELAKKISLDPFYVDVWARSAYAAEVLESREEGSYHLAPHMEKLLLDEEFPGHVGGVFNVMLQPEFFETFSKNFKTGERIWWSDCSPDFIQAVSSTGRPFYNRMIPSGFEKVPALKDKLEKGVNVLELCCGAGKGLAKLVKQYPKCTFTAQDGDSHSLELSKNRLKEMGIDTSVSFLQSTLEDIDREGEFDVVFINISMHECRDIEKVGKNVLNALKEGGVFVISDFPFPEDSAQCRTVPARIMCGIQFFEALIGDQLLPTRTFIDLLKGQGFQDVASVDLTPVHSVIWGKK